MMRKAEPMTTPAFPEPNHTQTPNNFFEMVADMSDAELRVTIIMIRKTFGWHRDSFKMGVDKLAKAAGLSRQGALDGAAAAEKRGTFRRTNPAQNKEAEWELVVALQPVDPSSELRADLQPVEGNPPAGRGLSGVKESKKKSKEIKEATPSRPKANTYPELVTFKEVTKRYPNEVNWGEVIDAFLKINLRLGRDATRDDLLPFYKFWTGKGYNPFGLGWLEWAVRGETPTNGRVAQQWGSEKPAGVSVAQSWLARKEREAQNVNA